MVASSSRLAYTDCYNLMDKALEDNKGIRIRFLSMEEARYFRLRLHQARKIDRRDNMEAYGDEHPMAGRSIYDGLVMRLRQGDGSYWVRIEKLDAQMFEVESLSSPIETIPLERMKRRI